ncbi:hypothetical protein CesoFtcFv8_021321 [Champsocephalus esox]|uniref:Uncharacterized protein n=1 Tax=Champsocephalus esox TaxID=159716 RepID=A0AAN8GKX7_9TELE|nr:hypothetical protein CesoFtcFv8_021321 [Champsocephalus esox]
MHEVKVRWSPMILHSQWLKYTSPAVFGPRSEPRGQRADALMDYSSQIPELCRTVTDFSQSRKRVFIDTSECLEEN